MLSISRLAIPNHIIWLLGGYLVFHSCLNISGELLYFADRDFYHDWWNSTNFSKFWQNWNLPVHRWFLRHIYKPLLAAGFSQKTHHHVGQLSIRLVSWRSDHDRVSRLLLLPRVHRFCSTEDAQALAVHWLHVQRSPGTKAHWWQVSQVSQVQLSEWLEERFGARAGNLSMWLFLVMGQPLLVSKGFWIVGLIFLILIITENKAVFPDMSSSENILQVMTYYHDYVVEHHGPALITHYGHLNSTALWRFNDVLLSLRSEGWAPVLSAASLCNITCDFSPSSGYCYI